MQRIRMSLPYFKENDWEAEVVMVNEKYSDANKDPLLVKCIPKDVTIHKVEAFSKKITSKFGLGSLALRSLYQYINYVNHLLANKSFDLIYFSTTEFPITILGNYWKKKFNIPYVIDMQDPWHSDYYQNKPKSERPNKYWFSYRLNKYLEPLAMKNVSGLISVSKGYIDDLQKSYANLKLIPTAVITFGAFKPDFDFVNDNKKLFNLPFIKTQGLINIVYVGRGGHDMSKSATLLFKALKMGLLSDPLNFEKIRFHFIGTSYAPQGKGIPTIKPIADEMGLNNYVNEQTDRIPYYNGIFCLINADALVILGSDDTNYTASKIYPYILAEKPFLAIFHPKSSACTIIKTCKAGKLISLIENNTTISEIHHELLNFTNASNKQSVNWFAFKEFEASNMAKLQCDFFNKIIN
ncbi:MAG: hypothetical protein V4546_04700 [Bacteroidota bacterium]